MFITPNLSAHLDYAATRGETGFRTTIVRSCDQCSGTVTQDCVLATGLDIVHWDVKFESGEWVRDTAKEPFVYSPSRGEILKNHHFVCDTCGDEQWS